MVRVHDEAVGALPEEMVEDVEEDRPAAERKQRLGRRERGGAEARAEAGGEDERDHRGTPNTMSAGRDGSRSRAASQSATYDSAMNSASATPSSEARALTAASGPSISAKSPSGDLVHDDDGPRGIRESPRRPQLLVPERGPIAEGLEDCGDGPRRFDLALPFDAALDSAGDLRRSLEGQEAAPVHGPKAQRASFGPQPARRVVVEDVRLVLPRTGTRAERSQALFQRSAGPATRNFVSISRGPCMTSEYRGGTIRAVPRYRLAGVRARTPKYREPRDGRAASRHSAGGPLRLRPRAPLARRAPEAGPLLGDRRRVHVGGGPRPDTRGPAAPLRRPSRPRRRRCSCPRSTRRRRS